MSPIPKIILGGIFGIVLFDGLASLASRSFGFPYVYATAGSWLIYAMVGFAIGRVAPISYAAAGVAFVALAESTIGWWLSWIIGPGRTKSGTINSTQVITAIVGVVVIGALIGGVAGALGRSGSKIETPAP
jgi:hypothetical protein